MKCIVFSHKLFFFFEITTLCRPHFVHCKCCFVIKCPDHSALMSVELIAFLHTERHQFYWDQRIMAQMIFLFKNIPNFNLNYFSVSPLLHHEHGEGSLYWDFEQTSPTGMNHTNRYCLVHEDLILRIFLHKHIHILMETFW